VAKIGSKTGSHAVKTGKSGKSAKTSKKRLVVSAQAHSPITVTPFAPKQPAAPPTQTVETAKSPKSAKPAPSEAKTDIKTTDPSAQATQKGESPQKTSAAPAPESVKRGRGRPRKGGKPPVLRAQTPARRLHRIGDARLLDAVAQVPPKKVPLAATRIVEQLESMLLRGQVSTYRGRKKEETLLLTKLEAQSLQEALELFKLKVTLQRGGQLRRASAG